ncbi:hypothetical protein LNTAR_11556 [Lentisphaera araneosa HTCC2155]|uniref:Uncharacterized protein n=1 Tax=Lentisphaera araneosa HTCC2155 TaxID=313628 RepID=A6DJB4_9BACT|nr:hypothetical protein LNTAR_11556 [Lentisphaera araneosa HTCC2155]
MSGFKNLSIELFKHIKPLMEKMSSYSYKLYMMSRILTKSELEISCRNLLIIEQKTIVLLGKIVHKEKP